MVVAINSARDFITFHSHPSIKAKPTRIIKVHHNERKRHI